MFLSFVTIPAGGIAAVGGILAANWDWFKNIPRPDLAYLSAIKLNALDGSGKEIMASDLWRNSRVQFKFPTHNAWGSNSPPPGRL